MIHSVKFLWTAGIVPSRTDVLVYFQSSHKNLSKFIRQSLITRNLTQRNFVFPSNKDYATFTQAILAC